MLKRSGFEVDDSSGQKLLSILLGGSFPLHAVDHVVEDQFEQLFAGALLREEALQAETAAVLDVVQFILLDVPLGS